jgi:hypothetical protein
MKWRYIVSLKLFHSENCLINVIPNRRTIKLKTFQIPIWPQNSKLVSIRWLSTSNTHTNFDFSYDVKTFLISKQNFCFVICFQYFFFGLKKVISPIIFWDRITKYKIKRQKTNGYNFWANIIRIENFKQKIWVLLEW